MCKHGINMTRGSHWWLGSWPLENMSISVLFDSFNAGPVLEADDTRLSTGTNFHGFFCEQSQPCSACAWTQKIKSTASPSTEAVRKWSMSLVPSDTQTQGEGAPSLALIEQHPSQWGRAFVALEDTAIWFLFPGTPEFPAQLALGQFSGLCGSFLMIFISRCSATHGEVTVQQFAMKKDIWSEFREETHLSTPTHTGQAFKEQDELQGGKRREAFSYCHIPHHYRG